MKGPWTLVCAITGLVLMGGLGMPPSTVAAQPSNSKPAHVCMERATQDGPRIRVILPASDVAGLIAKDFSPVACPVAFPTEADARRWRNDICRAAANLPESMQGQLERKLGERPAVLCGMAEQAMGQWDDGRGARQ